MSLKEKERKKKRKFIVEPKFLTVDVVICLTQV